MAATTTKLDVTTRAADGSRAARRLRRSGRVPGVLYGGGGSRWASTPTRASCASRSRARAPCSTWRRRRESRRRWCSRRPSAIRCAGRPCTSTCCGCALTRRFSAVVPLELTGVDEAPGVKEGGVLEQITRELNVEALPTAIPESIVHEVGEMQIGETIGLAAIACPAGVTLLDDVEEMVVATLSPPRLQAEVEEEIEAETELVGEGEAEPTARPRRALAARAPSRARSSCRCDAPRRRRCARRLADRRTGQPGRRVRGYPAQHRLHGRRGARRALGAGAREGPLRGRIVEGRVAAAALAAGRGGGPRVAVLCPQTYMNDAGRSVGPARGAFKLPLERVLVVHDEIDLPFGEVRARARRRAGRPQRAEVDAAGARRRGLHARARGRGAAGLDRPGDRLGIRARTLPRGPRARSRRSSSGACEQVEAVVLAAEWTELTRGRCARCWGSSRRTSRRWRSRARAATRSSRAALRPYLIAALLQTDDACARAPDARRRRRRPRRARPGGRSARLARAARGPLLPLARGGL